VPVEVSVPAAADADTDDRVVAAHGRCTESITEIAQGTVRRRRAVFEG
jgi:hypothetical protein